MTKTPPAVDANEIVAAPQQESQVTELALPTLNPEAYAAAVYEPFATRLKGAIDGVKSIAYDITTTAGMAVAVKARATFRDLRIEADKAREARKAPILKIGKLLQSGYTGIEERITPLEVMFDADIQAEITRKAELKAEAERVEAARAAAIRAKITEIIALPAKHAGSTSDQLVEALRELAAREITKDEFAEQTDDALASVDTAAAELMALRDAATTREAAALAAEEARKAETARMEAERAELARQRAENERIANEQAATARKLAEQQAAQAAEQRRIAEQAAANLKAEREAQELSMRLEREKQAEAQRKAADEIRIARESLEAAQAAHNAVMLAQQEAAQREAGHAEAIEMNAALDAAIASIEPLPPFHQSADAADLARCNAMVATARADNKMAESVEAYEAGGLADESELTNEDIIEFGAEIGLPLAELVTRLEAFTVYARAELLV